MDRGLPAAHCQDGPVLRPLSLPHRVPTESQLDPTRTGATSICKGGRLRPKKRQICTEIHQLYRSSFTRNHETKRYVNICMIDVAYLSM